MAGMAGGFVAGAIISKLILDTTHWDLAVKKVSGKLPAMAAKMGRVGQAMTKSVTIPLLAMGAAAVKVAADFDQSITESLAIMGDVSEETRKQMEDAAMEMSGQSTFAAKELGEAYFFLASAGMDAEQSIGALPAVTRFAQAGAFSLTTATDLLTDAQSALGLVMDDAEDNYKEMVHVSDVLVGANTIANASVQQFSESLTNKAGPALRSVEKEVEEGVAILAAFADQGVKGALAGNQLAIMLTNMETAQRNNSDQWETFGVSLFNADESMRNMADVIGDLETLLDGMSVKQKSATLAQMGFNDRALKSIKVLLGTSEKIRQYEKDLRSMGGITQEVSDKQLTSFTNQLKLLRNEAVNVGIEFGQELIPILKDHILPVLKSVVGWFSDLTDEQKALAVKVGIAVAALGPVLTISSKLVLVLPKLAGAFVKLGAKAGLAAGPLGLVVIALAFIAERSISAAKDFKTFTDLVEKEAESQGEKVGWLKKTWAGLNAVVSKYALGIDTTKLAQQAYNEHLAETNRKSTDWKGTLEGIVSWMGEVNTAYIEHEEELRLLALGYGDAGDAAETYGKKFREHVIPRNIQLIGIIADLKTQLLAGEIGWDDYATQVFEAEEELRKMTGGLGEADLAAEDLDLTIQTGLIPTVTDAKTLFAAMGVEAPEWLNEIATATKTSTEEQETAWDTFSDGLQTKWSSTFGDMVALVLKLPDDIHPAFHAIIQQVSDMAGQSIAKWIVGFIDPFKSSTKDAVKTVVGSTKDVATAATDLAKGFSPTGMIASAIGSAIGTFLGSILGPKGPSANDMRLVKDNTWATNQNVINLHDAVVAQLHEIKLTGWSIWGVLQAMPDWEDVQENWLQTIHKEIEETNAILASVTKAQHGAIHMKPELAMVGEEAPRVPEITMPVEWLGRAAPAGGRQQTQINLIFENDTQSIDLTEQVGDIMIKLSPELTADGRMKINMNALVQER